MLIVLKVSVSAREYIEKSGLVGLGGCYFLKSPWNEFYGLIGRADFEGI